MCFLTPALTSCLLGLAFHSAIRNPQSAILKPPAALLLSAFSYPRLSALICGGLVPRSPHAPIEKLSELIRFVRRRDFKSKRYLVRFGQHISEPVPWSNIFRIAGERKSLAVAGNSNEVIDRVPFAVGIEAAQLFRRRVYIHNHQVLMRHGRALFRRRILRMVLPNQDFVFQIRFKSE